jgi:hypothetical protein
MTDAERDLVLAMLGQAVEAVTRGDWQRAEGSIRDAWRELDDAARAGTVGE